MARHKKQCSVCNKFQRFRCYQSPVATTFTAFGDYQTRNLNNAGTTNGQHCEFEQFERHQWTLAPDATHHRTTAEQGGGATVPSQFNNGANSVLSVLSIPGTVNSLSNKCPLVREFYRECGSSLHRQIRAFMEGARLARLRRYFLCGTGRVRYCDCAAWV